MKHQIPDNWQLWIIVSIVFLIMSAVLRTVTLTMGWSEFNSNIAFIVSLGFWIVLYGTFQQLFNQFIMPKIDPLLKKKNSEDFTAEIESETSNEKSPIENPSEKIIIDYAATREGKKRKNEQRMIELESRIIRYIGDILSAHLTSQKVEEVIDRVTEFLHMTSVPAFSEGESIELPDLLSTTDMMHFGWNIAKPFKKPNLHTAYFLKQIFAHTFRNTEVYTIKKKLRLSPQSGIIKIDTNIASYGETGESGQQILSSLKMQSDEKIVSAKEVAIADMNCEDLPDCFNIEEVFMDSDY